MTDNVYVNADRSKVVPESAPGKKYQMSRKEAVRLGLLDSEQAQPQKRRAVSDSATSSKTPQKRRYTKRK